MADLPYHIRSCLHTGKLALLAILVSGGLYCKYWYSSILCIRSLWHLDFGHLVLLNTIATFSDCVITLQACALYNNWWPMLTVLMYVLLPMPLLFFAGSNASSLYSESSSGWIDATKFLTGASVVGSIAIPVILKHAGVICWGALAMELSSFFIFGMAILCFIGTNDDDAYSMF